MINKKAQMGKIIVTFPVMLIIVVIMALFIFLSFTISALHKPSSFQASETTSTEKNLLMQKVKIPTIDQEKYVLVLDAIQLYENKLTSRSIFEESLKELLNSKTNCVAIAKSLNENPSSEKGGAAYDDILIEFIDEQTFVTGTVGSIPLELQKYKEKNLFNKFSFKNKDSQLIFVEYYYGVCL